MLTRDTFRVSEAVMTFSDIITRWPTLQDLAGDLDLPVKNVRRWQDIGSIPAEWFVSVQSAAKARGFADVTIRTLSEAAHSRRLSKVSAEAANDSTSQERAA